MSYLTIGERLDDLIKSKGGTYESEAKKIGTSQCTLSDFINGNRTSIRSSTLTKICERYNVSADYMLGLSDVPTRNETIQGINEKIGLSGETIAILQTEKETGNTAFAEFFDYIIKNPELLMRCITAIHTKNSFESSPCHCHMDIDGNDIEMSMSSIYKTYMDETFEQIIKGFSLKGEGEK